MNRFIQIDEDGKFHFEGLLLQDDQVIRNLFSSMGINEGKQVFVSHEGLDALVESYNAPLMVHRVDIKNQKLILDAGFEEPFSWDDLRVDFWDRFCGVSSRGLYFILLRKAQNSFFNEVESFDDDSVCLEGGRKIEIPPLFSQKDKAHPVSSSSFWDEIYKTQTTPPWDLEEPSPVLKDFLPQLKLLKSRILVAGAGRGWDAEFLQKKGHQVTGLDFSKEAIKKAQKEHPASSVSWEESDIFKIKKEESFDVIFEHTLFCAVDPYQRQELIETYYKLLEKGGLMIGVFFVGNASYGPPYGSSEWEINEYLKKRFRILHWLRSKSSISERLGMELLVVAQKAHEIG